MKGKKEDIKKLLDKFSRIIPERYDKTYTDNFICADKNNVFAGCWYDEKRDKTYDRQGDICDGLKDGCFKMKVPEIFFFPDLDKIKPQPPEVLESLEKNDGSNPLWYRWRLENWGTKWGTYSNTNKDGAYMFETAWNAIPDMIHKIADSFPMVEIDYKWSDEDSSYNCGEILFINGKRYERKIENDSPEAWDMYFELHEGYKEDYIKKEDGTYRHKEDD